MQVAKTLAISSICKKCQNLIYYFIFSIAECGPLTNPTHGEVAFSDGTTLDHAASYACYTGYDLSHSYARYCLSDGSWSYIEPTCVKRGKV